MDHPAYHTRDTSSEPRFPIKSKSEELVPDLQKAPSFNFFLESDNMLGVKRKAGRADHTFLLPHDPGQFPMDTGQCLVAVFMQQEFCAFFYFKDFNQSLLMKHFFMLELDAIFICLKRLISGAGGKQFFVIITFVTYIIIMRSWNCCNLGCILVLLHISIICMCVKRFSVNLMCIDYNFQRPVFISSGHARNTFFLFGLFLCLMLTAIRSAGREQRLFDKYS